MHLLAAMGDTWPDWITVPANLGGVICLAVLWMTGRITLTADANRRVADATAAAHVLAEERALEERLAAVVADRDAWRAAHAAEVEARHTSEAAGAKALEGQNVTLRLLSTLESALGNKGKG